MDDCYFAFVKGSVVYRDVLRYSVVIRKINDTAERNYFEYREEIRGEGYTSAYGEYKAIATAIKSVPHHSTITIFTNNETAIMVFSGEWKAKKYKDIIEDFAKNSVTRHVRVVHPTDVKNPLVAIGMKEAESLCKNKMG